MKIFHIARGRYGDVFCPVERHESESYCDKCGELIPDGKVACIACVEVGTAKPRVRREKIQPDADGLFAGVPGIDPYHLPEPKHGGRK